MFSFRGKGTIMVFFPLSGVLLGNVIPNKHRMYQRFIHKFTTTQVPDSTVPDSYTHTVTDVWDVCRLIGSVTRECLT